MVLKGKKAKTAPTKARKTKKWRKGHSCVSNPESKKHREAAKNRFFNVSAGPSSLTTDALAKHDAHHEDDDGDIAIKDDASDTRSCSAKSFSTWASNWTECSNVTFSRIHRYWTSDSSQHKAVLAVLAAITEVIKANGGKESDTEYFAALMTALDGDPEDLESLTAILYLLHISMRRVPVSVLKSKFSPASKVLMQILTHHMASDSSALLRSAVQCLSQLLRVQEAAIWSNSSTTHIYNALLTFALHTKPKVRKAAQMGVVGILRGAPFMTQPSPPAHHPAAHITSKFCIEQIEACGGSGEAMITLHVLGLLQDVLPVLTSSGIKSVCETILKVMTLANVIVSSTSMKCLHHMFVSRPNASSLSAELNAQIITALYDFQPGENDWQLMSAWLSLMKEAHSNLRNLKEDLFLSHLPRYFAIAMQCLRETNAESAKMASQTLTSLLKEDVAPLSGKLGTTLQTAPKNTQTVPHKLFKAVENGLSYQYHANWHLVIQLLAVSFEVLGNSCHSLMYTCLRTMADLRGSHDFAHRGALDKAVGFAVRTMGPSRVLKAIPLKITGDQDSYDFPNSWLLPVIRDNVRDTELGFFTSYFLPLAAKLRNKALLCAESRNMVEAKTYDALQLQIWSLLPGFCTRPTDLLQSFKGLAKVLGVALTDREDIRMDVLSAIRKLILHNVDQEENKSELAKFAKNYLPLFFNMFTTKPEHEKDATRLAVLETVKVYARITEKQLIASYIDMCHTKGTEGEISSFRRYALLDLMIALVPHTDVKTLNNIYPQIVQQLKSSDRTVQKKSYRILEEICGSENVDCKQFVTTSLEEFQQSLLTALSSSSPSAKAPRLRCLIQIFKQLSSEEMEFVHKVIPEATLCTKAAAEKARQGAFTLLIEMVQALFRWNPDTPKAATLQTFYEMVFMGLDGTPNVIVCTILALGRITYEFKDYLTDELIAILIESTALLLGSNAREIVKAALSLLKVLVTTFDVVTIGQSLDKIVTSLVTMKKDSQHHLRFKAKDIFTRLVRKFGYNAIINKVPESHHKMLAHVHKMQERAKRKKLQKASEEGDEDDDDEMGIPRTKPESFEEYLADSDSDLEPEEERPRPKGRKSRKAEKNPPKGAAWLREDADEGVVDFLDPSVSKKVMATRPQSGPPRKKMLKDVFKTASDGRLIIKDDSDDEAGSGKKKGKAALPIDDLDELMDALDGPKKKSKKRKLTADDDNEDESPMKYKAGGSGIHRPMKKAAPGKEYRAKKAGGDIKKQGKHDPYAYVPLEFSTLNKRKKAKASGQFKNFVRGAKKGAQKGQKLRAKKKK